MRKAIAFCICLGLAVALTPIAAFAVVLNEVFVSHVGTDTQEFIELCGSPGEDLSNVWLVIIEGEGTGAGLCDDAIDIDNSFATMPADGRLVIGNATVPNVDLVVTGASDLFENGTETVLLVSTTTPIVQGTTDVDTNNDGNEEISLGTIVDGVGLVDAQFPATDFIYYDQPTVADGTLFPAGVQRCADCSGSLTRLMCFNISGCAEPYSDVSPGAANICPGPSPEACCFVDGGCVDLLPEDCIAQGGTPQGEGTTCDSESVTCPVFGACCFADGSCQELSDIDCLNAGGTFQGGGTACGKGGSNCPQPPQACCFADGSCQDLDAGECILAGGFPQGSGTACAGFVCPQPPQACCFPDGGCVDADVQVCIDSGGTPQGAGSSCASTDCPDATEACCYIDGFCADLTPAECSSTGGVSQGAGTSCATTFCPPPPPVGACCLADGSCVDGIYESDCFARGGTFNVGLLCQEVQCNNATEQKSWGEIKGQYR